MDITLGFDAVKFIDSKVQFLVTGFVKEINQTLNNKLDNIPPLIPNACLLFYCIREDFTAKGDNIRVDTDIIKTVNVGQNTVYGKMVIKPEDNKYIYKWVIQITQTNYQFFAFSFGIDSSNKYIMNDDFSVSGQYGNADKFYAFGSDGLKNGYKYTNLFPPKGKQYGEKCGLMDKITMILNTGGGDENKGTLEYYKNDKSMGIAFDNVDLSKTYHMAICMRGIGKIRLITFQQKFSK